MPSLSSRFFSPVMLGRIGPLAHRVVMAPLTRMRNNEVHEPTDLAVEYYTQRASVPGTLIITEGIFISLRASGMIPGSPGLWTEGQVNAWRKVTDAVHARGSFIVAQIFAAGLAADPVFLAEVGRPHASASDSPSDTSQERPRGLTREDIQEYVKQYDIVARNAMLAGFDGVELHLGNGYLMDQFLQTNSNTRKDEYGGSVENRLRFALQAMKAIADAVGEDRVGFRVTPWSRFQGMGMPAEDIVETFSALFGRIRDEYPHTAYAHVVQPRISATEDDDTADAHRDDDQTDADAFLKKIWGRRAYIAAGGYERESAVERADATGDLIAFGRKFVANPDLPTRLRKGTALNAHDRPTFYTKGPVGYTDYPFVDEIIHPSD